MKHTVSVILAVLLLLTVVGVAPDSTAAGLGEVGPEGTVTGLDRRAGTCYSYYTDGGSERPYMPLAYEAGSRWDRFDFVWPRFEPKEGKWSGETVKAYDAVVGDLKAAGFSLVGILLWTPDWAATSGASTLSVPETGGRPPGWYAPAPGAVDSLGPMSTARAASSPPKGLYQPWDDWTSEDGDPANTWGRFVYRLVEQYSDRVKHWEMWNEPEWEYFWTGTSSDYARLLKVGYQATKAACSDCQVLFGGLHYWAKPNYYKWVLNALKDDPQGAANNYFFDVMSVHLYSRSANTYDVVNEIRSEMKARVSDHPIWLTETGVPLWGDSGVPIYKPKYDYAATPEEAAAYVIQSYANAWAAGVERYLFFRTHDADMPDLSAEYFGLIRNNRSLRPAYAAYKVATTYLVSPSEVTSWSYSSGARRVTLWGTPWGKVSVVWNTTPNGMTFEYPAIEPMARLVDPRGGEQLIEPKDGVYRLSLPGATANLEGTADYYIGGDPYVIVEADGGVPEVRTVHVEVGGVYGDADGDGERGEGEEFLTNVSFRLVDMKGRDIATGVGASWTFAGDVRVGGYRVVIAPKGWPSLPPGWLPRHLPVWVGLGEETLTIRHEEVGLPPHRTSGFFPIMARNG
ncbi:MAG: hypothetical protein R6X31_12485 [Anaerolineae bacterium]